MRSIERDLEAQHSALHSSIKSPGNARNADHGREITKDPFAFAVADHRARQLREVTRALEDVRAERAA